jgi:hypothetical protein
MGPIYVLQLLFSEKSLSCLIARDEISTDLEYLEF